MTTIQRNDDGTVTIEDRRTNVCCVHESIDESKACTVCGEWSDVGRKNQSPIGIALISVLLVSASMCAFLLIWLYA